MDELEFQASFRPAAPVTVGQVLARQMAMPDRREIEQAAAEREAEAARAERAEAVAMINAQRGNPLGEVTRAQAVVAACRDEVTDLEARLEAARARFQEAADRYVDFSRSADEVLSAGAQRSHTPDMLAEAKRALAAVRVEEQLAAPRPEPRPFSPGGRAVRSEVTCAECRKVGATPEQSFLIHQDPAPPQAPEVPSGDELDWLRDRGLAERRYGSYAEIVR